MFANLNLAVDLALPYTYLIGALVPLVTVL
jgi:hypothetical protein